MQKSEIRFFCMTNTTRPANLTFRAAFFALYRCKVDALVSSLVRARFAGGAFYFAVVQNARDLVMYGAMYLRTGAATDGEAALRAYAKLEQMGQKFLAVDCGMAAGLVAAAETRNVKEAALCGGTLKARHVESAFIYGRLAAIWKREPARVIQLRSLAA